MHQKSSLQAPDDNPPCDFWAGTLMTQPIRELEDVLLSPRNHLALPNGAIEADRHFFGCLEALSTSFPAAHPKAAPRTAPPNTSLGQWT